MTAHEGVHLLETLKQLYSRMTALHFKASTGPGANSGSADLPPNIALPLYEYVDRIAASAQKTSANVTSPQGSVTKTNGHSPTAFSRDPALKGELGELSVHLRDSHKHSGVFLDMGDKLMQSTWDHFYTAIRLARQGDAQGARVHAGLMNNALAEAANYVSEPVYVRFAKDVMKAFDTIKQQGL